MINHKTLAVVAFVATTVWAAPARSAFTCNESLFKAAGAYAKCQLSALASSKSGEKCREKYSAAWDKLVEKGVCIGARFTDNGDGTVTDKLTGLVWEQKTDDSTVHDKDNLETWSAAGSAAEGTAFTSFLSSLNSGGCFAGQCDWRLPSREELQTILNVPEPCVTDPCIDPILGPTQSEYYWSGTSDSTDSYAWFTYFGTGSYARTSVALKTEGHSVRAVRGGR